MEFNSEDQEEPLMTLGMKNEETRYTCDQCDFKAAVVYMELSMHGQFMDSSMHGQLSMGLMDSVHSYGQ